MRASYEADDLIDPSCADSIRTIVWADDENRAIEERAMILGACEGARADIEESGYLSVMDIRHMNFITTEKIIALQGLHAAMMDQAYIDAARNGELFR